MDAILIAGNEDEIIAFQAEFNAKEAMVWNPNYLVTLLFFYRLNS
jgi:hypothetical protein